jgi:hypothetical protein
MEQLNYNLLYRWPDSVTIEGIMGNRLVRLWIAEDLGAALQADNEVHIRGLRLGTAAHGPTVTYLPECGGENF